MSHPRRLVTRPGALPALLVILVALCPSAPAPAADTPTTKPADVPGSPAPATFKAGFAERDITPDIGMEQPGGYGKAYHRARHDPCKVRASVFDDGHTRVAVVGVDALALRADTVARARQAIRKRCGIGPREVLIAASHSHSAGPTVGPLPGEFDGASDLVKSLAYEKSICANPQYLAKVEAAIADAVVEADGRRVEARCAAGLGEEGSVAFNRRFRMKDGRTYTHPGQGNPDIVEPAGPVDPAVGVIGAWDKDGKLLGCVVNYACHCTTGPGGTSADYVYYIEKTIRGLMGDQAVVVFLPGAAGDVTQVDNRSPYATRQFGEPISRLVGGRVGAEALKVLLSAQASAGALAPLASESKLLHIKRRVPSPEHVEQAMELVKKQPGKGVDASDWTFAKETVLLAERLKKEPVADVEVQAVQIGPAVLLACPCEYFCEYGLDLRAGSKFPFTFPVTLANGRLGYVPTEEAFGTGGGGYETRLTSYSNLDVTAGRQIRDALLELSNHLTPGVAPSPPALKPEDRGKPWAYGNRPPQVD